MHPLKAGLWAVVRGVARDLAGFLFPRVCVACARAIPGSSDGFTCESCWQRVTPLPHPRCPRCGHPLRAPACHWCANVHPAVSCVRSWCWADNVVARPLIHALKYQGWHAASGELAARMARLDLGPLPATQPRILVPVPLSEGRLRERGYNQSACLAAALARRWHTGPPVELLTRSRETPTQTRLTPVQRLHNVASAFRVDERRLSTCGDAALILVDDVVTTGATLNACADALASAGAHTICYITFGRARDPRDARPSRGTSPHGHSGRH